MTLNAAPSIYLQKASACSFGFIRDQFLRENENGVFELDEVAANRAVREANAQVPTELIPTNDDGFTTIYGDESVGAGVYLYAPRRSTRVHHHGLIADKVGPYVMVRDHTSKAKGQYKCIQLHTWLHRSEVVAALRALNRASELETAVVDPQNPNHVSCGGYVFKFGVGGMTIAYDSK